MDAKNHARKRATYISRHHGATSGLPPPENASHAVTTATLCAVPLSCGGPSAAHCRDAGADGRYFFLMNHAPQPYT
jgi:hypothetical protein